MAAGLELRELGVRRRAVHVLQRRAQVRHVLFALDLRRQPVRQLAVADRRERLRGEVSEPALLHALRDRIDRRQHVLHGLRVGRCGVFIFGMDDFRAVLAAAHLAEAAQALAAHELLLLRAAEVEEAQRQETGAVGEAQEQRAPPAEDDLGELDRALDRDAHAGAQRADRHDARAVLVARRQPEEEVRDGFDAELREALGECRPDAFQRGDRTALDRHGTREYSRSRSRLRAGARQRRW